MRRLAPLVLFLIATACAGTAQLQPNAPLQPAPPQSVTSDRSAGRLLDQASWGPTSDAIAEVRRMGIRDWLDWQFSLSESDLPDQPILDANGKPYRNFAPLQAAFFQNAVSGQDQLRQRVAFALSEIWVVSGVTLPRPYAFPPYWRIFRDNAFGNYRDLIKAVTLSPAMGAYLNMANNNKPANGASANENYARELLQLFTIGLTRLNADGTPVLDADHNPAAAYTQADVTNLARAFTGWTYAPAPGVAARPNNPAYFYGHMIAVQSRHDPTEKTVLGEKLPAGETAEQDLEAVLDILMRQETMAPFICRQLIQHLVTSNPSPDYIRRVSQVFLDDGQGVRGDMRAVTRAILLDPEARSGDDDGAPEPRDFGHLREPVLFVANLLRGLNATAGPENGATAAAGRLGQPLFFSPSVFSYFSPQYRTAGGVGGPEFQIYSTQTASFRANLVNQVLYQTLDKSTVLDLAGYAAEDVNATLDHISHVFLHDSMSTELHDAASKAADLANTPLARARAALYVVLTSAEFQVIH